MYDLQNIYDVMKLIKEEEDEIVYKSGDFTCVILRDKKLGTLEGYVGVRTDSSFVKSDEVYPDTYFYFHSEKLYADYNKKLDRKAKVEELYWVNFHCHHEKEMKPYQEIEKVKTNYHNTNRYNTSTYTNDATPKSESIIFKSISKLLYRMMPTFIKTFYEDIIDIIKTHKKNKLPIYRDINYVKNTIEEMIEKIICDDNICLSNLKFHRIRGSFYNFKREKFLSI